MKKQFLIMMFLCLAFVFVGVNKSFGQYIDYLQGAPTCVAATPLTCATEDALHPLPGKEYTYSITTDPETVGSVLWFVTDQAEVIDYTTGAPVLQPTRDPGAGTGDYILTNDGHYNTASANKSIDISWQTFDGLTNQVLLVAYVAGANGCSDNVEVFRIQPAFAFTLEIVALLNDGTEGDEECVSPVESAEYNGTSLDVDYGENYVFFRVNAANFVDSWQPTFTVTDNTGGSVIGDVEWAYPAQAILAAGTWNAASVPVDAQVLGGAVGEVGECIILRVRLDHGENEIAEGTTASITVGVDGIMYDPAASTYTNLDLRDLDEPTAPSTDCDPDVTDEATYTLTPRPDMTSTTPASSTDPTIQNFVPINP